MTQVHTVQPGMPGSGEQSVGLGHLSVTDKVTVKQKFELAEVVLGWETKNKYAILNNAGQQIYYAYEESGCCTRQCCANARGFTLHITDNDNKEVMRVVREFKCCSGICNCLACPGGCFSADLTVEAPPGNVVGSVQQRATCFTSSSFIVLDQMGKQTMDIEGPCCCRLFTCADKVYQVRSVNGLDVGEIRKTWAGCCAESLTDRDNFSLTFPFDLSTTTKATLIGATFLIDFMSFESTNTSNNA